MHHRHLTAIPRIVASHSNDTYMCPSHRPPMQWDLVVETNSDMAAARVHLHGKFRLTRGRCAQYCHDPRAAAKLQRLDSAGSSPSCLGNSAYGGDHYKTRMGILLLFLQRL